MADIERLGKSKKLQRWVSVQVAFQKTGEALEGYTRSVLQTVHDNIKQAVVGQNLPDCTNGCSKQLKGHKNISR